VHPSPWVSAQTSSPHVGAGMIAASTWSSRSVPCRAVGRHRHATASWPLVRPWSLGGWRSNSLATDNAPGSTLDGVRDVCAAVCCCAACTAAVPGTGRLGTCGMEEAASSSTRKSTKFSMRCSTICTIMLSKKTSKNLKPRPLPGTPNIGEEILRPGGGTHPP
jgi:hypothetical protein